MPSANASVDDFYVGLVAPAASYATFCANGCVFGLAPMGIATVGDTHVAVATGYRDPTTALAALGHNLGRGNVSCTGITAVQPDARYPYKGGAVGGAAYDVVNKKMLTPSDAYFDFMSSCRPAWVSDYTFAGLAATIAKLPHSAQ